MFYSGLLLAATVFSSLVSSQSQSQNTSGTSLTIDPNSVPRSERQAWCRAQTTSCPQICGGQAMPNRCDPDTLTYACTCTDGSTPNISDYQSTLPFYICLKSKDQCVAAHSDLSGQRACLAVTCGQRNASDASASSTTSSSAASSSTAAASSSGSGAAGAASGSATASASASATRSASAAAMGFAQNYGTSALFAGMLAVFGLAL
ncbi:hypothetical protein LTR66_008979 [Elasticomyces elasticus]|nr:hypothetical protein LTR66_008979 [Elasticomyces elasticus]